MTFGQKIKQLRTDNNWTQEQFAELMGVSAQAVSRWETDSSMPDISLIAPIAYTFNVSCDYLLGVDLRGKDKDIYAIRKRAFESVVGDNPEKWFNAANMIREGLKVYPDSWVLKNSLVVFLAILSLPQNNENYAEAGKELNVLCEEIIAKCPNQKSYYNAVYWMCHSSNAITNRERAIELAKTMPHHDQCQEELLKIIENIHDLSS